LQEDEPVYPDSKEILTDMDISVENGIANPGHDNSKSNESSSDVVCQTRLWNIVDI